jgi:hypothetical protein
MAEHIPLAQEYTAANNWPSRLIARNSKITSWNRSPIANAIALLTVTHNFSMTCYLLNRCVLARIKSVNASASRQSLQSGA